MKLKNPILFILIVLLVSVAVANVGYLIIKYKMAPRPVQVDLLNLPMAKTVEATL